MLQNVLSKAYTFFKPQFYSTIRVFHNSPPLTQPQPNNKTDEAKHHKTVVNKLLKMSEDVDSVQNCFLIGLQNFSGLSDKDILSAYRVASPLQQLGIQSLFHKLRVTQAPIANRALYLSIMSEINFKKPEARRK